GLHGVRAKRRKQPAGLRIVLLLAGGRRARRRIERAFAAAAGKAKRGDKRAEQSQADEWTAAEMGHDARSLHGRHNSKTGNQGEVRISLFPAFSAISSPARARFWARCRHSSRGF